MKIQPPENRNNARGSAPSRGDLPPNRQKAVKKSQIKKPVIKAFCRMCKKLHILIIRPTTAAVKPKQEVINF